MAVFNNFDEALYPHQRIRNLIAIVLMVLLHLLVAYFLLRNAQEQPIKMAEQQEELLYLDLQAPHKKGQQTAPNLALQAPRPARPKKQPRKSTTISKPAPPVQSQPDIMSQITAARKKRQAAETEAIQQDQAAQPATPSEDDLALARIKANIASATYSKKGTNGIFQVLDKGVQTGRFSFRGWMNNPRESTWRTYEVDAGVGGNVELALVRKMIEIIREHYSGDFNWDSQRLGRVVVLSARQKDNASLEKFLMKEFFE
jgi:hypothetical protein